MITATHYVLAVGNLARTSDFYENVLGFVAHAIGDGGWRFLKKDDCVIMAGACPDAPSPMEIGDHSYFAYLIVDNVDAYFSHILANIEAHGGAILKAPRDEPWGMRELALRTCDGHRIMIAQENAR